MPRHCEHCLDDLRPAARSDARFCGGSCRVMAARMRKRNPGSSQREFPAAMTRAARWVRRTARKVPLNAVTGRPASSTDPTTWSAYPAARESRHGAGSGFVAGDGVGCIDLDHVVGADGRLSDAAEAFLATLPPTFIEVSMSGTGLHVFGTGVAGPNKKTRRDDIAGEVISRRKYVAATGIRFRSAPLKLGDISEAARTFTN